MGNNTLAGAPRRGRMVGIDLLRIISMFMIVVHHVLGHGGLLSDVQWLSPQYITMSGLSSVVRCSVDCFALISGFVGIKVSFKWSRAVSLWFQTIFYTLLILAAFYLYMPEVIGRRTIVAQFFPVVTKQYWYLSAYILTFAFIPLMNLAVEKLPRRVLRNSLIFILVTFAFIPCIFTQDPGIFKEGYSPIWLMIMYILGAYVRKYEIYTWFSRLKCFIVFVCSSFLALMCKLAYECITNELYDKPKDGLVYLKYISPFMLLSALALLFIFANTNFKKPSVNKLIEVVSPTCFSVYLIHDNKFISKYLVAKISKIFGDVNDIRSIKLPLLILGLSVGMFCCCSAVDLVRIQLFKLLKVKNLSEWVGGTVGKAADKFAAAVKRMKSPAKQSKS